jgi:ABC-type Fe3+ transport system permease subunit
MDASGKSVKRLLIGSLWAIWAVLFVLLLLLLFVPSTVAATPAEKSGYRTTQLDDETMASLWRVAGR